MVYFACFSQDEKHFPEYHKGRIRTKGVRGTGPLSGNVGKPPSQRKTRYRFLSQNSFFEHKNVFFAVEKLFLGPNIDFLLKNRD